MQAAFCWKARKSSEEKAGGSAEVYRKIQMVFQTPQDSFDPMQTLETGILEAFRNQGMSRKEACLHLPELLKKWNLVRKRRCAIPARRGRRRVPESRNCAGSCCAAVSSDLRRGNECARCGGTGADRSTAEKLQREEGLAMLWIGHDLALVRELCSRSVIVMRQGKIVEQGRRGRYWSTRREEYTETVDGV